MPKLGKTLICIECHENQPIKGRICSKCWYKKQKTYLLDWQKKNGWRYRKNIKLRQSVIDHYGARCNDCGWNHVPEVFEVHHLNRDHSDNRIENLSLLCPTCHAVRHFEERTASWRNYRSRL